MASLDSLQMRSLSKKGFVQQIYDDEGIAIRLRPTAAAGAITSVTVTTGTNIVAISASGGTETWAFATYDTVAKLKAVIDASAYWDCVVLDTLLSEATTTQFVDGAIAATVVDSVSYYDVLVDTSAADYMAVCVTKTRTVGESKPKGSMRVHLRDIEYNITFGGGVDSQGLRVYERKGSIENLLYSGTPVDATLTNKTFASGEGFISTQDGYELVVYMVDATSVTGYVAAIGEIE